MANGAVTAVQFPAKRNRLKFFQHGPVGPACGTWEDRIVGGRICRTEGLEQHDEFLGNGHLSLLPVLGMKPPVGLSRDAHSHVLEINIAPCDEAPFRVTKS